MRTKDEIRERHLQSTADFDGLVAALTEARYAEQSGGKWSAAQNLEHLIKVNRMILLAVRLPVFALRLLFGRNPGQARSEAALMELYRPFSEKGVAAPSAYVPSANPKVGRAELLRKHSEINRKLATKIMQWSEADLDHCRVPHPFWGKIPVRELLMFNIFHTEHHLHNLRRQLEN